MSRKKGNDIDGILLLDKPLGRTSNSALQKVRYLFNAKKAGHTGSLDPLATGVLPICFGQASKVTPLLLNSNKRYLCTLELGSITTSGDKEGDVLETREITPFNETEIETILPKFRGEIKQIPPMYSALKHNGQPLYKLARQGIEIKRKEREVTIHKLELVEYTNNTITFDVMCSKGTYIRTLAQDIGEELGCGAHLSMLKRTEVEPFDCSKLYTIEEIETLATANDLDKTLLAIDSVLQDHPSLTLADEETARIKNGLKVSRRDIPNSQLIRLYDSKKSFIGIGRYSSDHQLAAKRLMKTN
ncbi:MAG: tRNA pseudouridine(55) synthase TruB [Cocleimonas sp.]